ncbi:MAG TPA: cell wall hydrolase [Lachnospiraceae bacterium]|nr:cell wall hydrolase [Lachnospiraceae bacterium]
MKRKFFRLKKHICLLLALTMLFLDPGLSVPVCAETTSEKIQKAEELKRITEEQKQFIEDQKDDLVEQKSELQYYLSKLNGDLQEISDNIELIEAQIGMKRDEILSVQKELNKAREEESAQYELMKMRVRHIYENSSEGLLTRILNSKNYTDFVNRAEYVMRMEEYDRKILKEISALRESIESAERKLEEEMEELSVLMQQTEEEQNKVTLLVSATNGSIAATSGAISAAELEQAAYDAELRSQEENLAALKRQLAEEQAMSAKAAKMSWRDVSEIGFKPGDRDLLAALIYCEAGSEPYTGQVAVGAVVINRMRSAAFPNTMVGVIYQKSQFSPVASGRLATRLSLGANESCYRAADEAMRGSTPVGNCLYFRTVIPQINGQIIGGHVFY